MAQVLGGITAPPAFAGPQVRRISVKDLTACLSQGWDDFRTTPTQLFFLCIVYPIVGLVAARAAFGGSVVPLLFPLVSGFALVGPISALGLYELSRRREQGEDVSWLNSFDVLRSPSIGSIAVVSVVLVAIFVAWLAAATAIYHGVVGDMAPATLGSLTHDVFHTSEGIRLTIVGNLVGFLFAAGVLSMTIVSLPMLLDRNVGALVAIRTSLRTVWVNPAVMAIWGLIVGVSLAVGAAFLMVGLALVLPILGHATWHLYRRVVV